MGDIQGTGIQSVRDHWVSLFRNRGREACGPLLAGLTWPSPPSPGRSHSPGELRGGGRRAGGLRSVTSRPPRARSSRRRGLWAGGGAPAARAGRGRGAQRGQGRSREPLPSAPSPAGPSSSPGSAFLPSPARPPSLLLFLAEALLQQPGSMAAVETRVCETDGCSSEAKLQCPTCIKLGIQGSYFCSQVDAGGGGGGGLPPLPSAPALAAGRDALLLFPSAQTALPPPPPPPPAPAPLPPPAVLGPSRPGPRSVEAMWAGSGSGVARGRPAALGSRVEGPVPAAHILPGQRLPGVRATWDRGRPSRESRSCRSFRQGSGVGSRGAGLQGP